MYIQWKSGSVIILYACADTYILVMFVELPSCRFYKNMIVIIVATTTTTNTLY
jgi:hypothetical protein